MTQGETFGAALAVVASIISNLGVNIQKYSHADEAKAPLHEQRAYVQRPMWWLGLALVFFGSLGDFAAFGFATQSLVAALGGGSTLVANVFTAYFLNRETLYAVRRDVSPLLYVEALMIRCLCRADRSRWRVLRHHGRRDHRLHRRAQRGVPAARAGEALRAHWYDHCMLSFMSWFLMLAGLALCA